MPPAGAGGGETIRDDLSFVAAAGGGTDRTVAIGAGECGLEKAGDGSGTGDTPGGPGGSGLDVAKRGRDVDPEAVDDVGNPFEEFAFRFLLAWRRTRDTAA